MASLVAPLASGVIGATSGTAEFYNQGTGTLASVYSDPEGVTLVTSHVLDANGGIARYVVARVDVVVKNSGGATVRTFTWGTDSHESRVNNSGFTGTLAGGGTAPGGRTTVDAVLSSLFASLGAIDGKVLVNGVSVNIKDALAGLSGIVFSVKSYGALGNGTTDDRAAIIATIAAAIAAGGGTVFFPPGTYKILGQITVPNNSKVCFLGASESGVTIVQHTTATNGWFLIGTDSVSFANITFSRNAAAMTGRILQAAGKVALLNCTFVGWGGTDLYFETDDTAEFNCYGCKFTQDENIGFLGTGNAVESRLRFTDCTFYVTVNNATCFRGLSGAGQINLEFKGCYFRLTGQSITIVSDETMARFSDCHIQTTGVAGTYHIGDGDSYVFLTACRVYSPGAPIALGGAYVFEAACHFAGTVSSLANNFQSAYRERRYLETTLIGATVAYSPTTEIRTHLLNYAGTNVGTLTINAPSAGWNTGDRLEFIIYHLGASGPSAIAWNAQYGTAVVGGSPAVTASIAMGAVLRFNFTFSGTKWVQGD